MVTVPQYQRTEVDRPIHRTELTTRATPEDMGAGIGRGLGAVANGLGQAAQAAAQIRDIEDQTASKEAENAFAEWDRAARYGDTGLLTLTGKDAVDAVEKYTREMDTRRKEFSQKLTPGAQQYFAQAIDGRIASSLETLSVHAATEKKRWVIDTASSRVASFANDAVQDWRSPMLVEENIKDGVAELRRQGELSGWTPEVTASKVETYTSLVRTNVLLQQANQDPIAAAMWAYENADELTAEDGYALTSKLVPMVKAAAALESKLTPDGVESSERVNKLLEAMPDFVEAEVRAGVAQELLAAQTQQAAQTKAAYEQHRGALELGVLTGDVASEERILGDPILADDDKATLLRSFRTEQGSEGAARAYVNSLAMGTSAPLNPYDDDDKKLADKALESIVAAVPPEQAALATVEFVKESGVIPSSLVAGLRNGLASTDSAVLSRSLELVAGLSDVAPTALGAAEHGQELQDAAATYREFVQNRGLTVNDAAQFIVDGRKPEVKEERKLLSDGWKQAIKDSKFSVMDVRKSFDTSILWGEPSAGTDPLAEASLTADYFAAAERAFTGAARGDVDLARTMALAEVKRVYGVTKISGDEVIMRLPPEQFYPAFDGGHEYLRDLALADAREMDPKASKVRLMASVETSQDVRAGKPPRYNLVWQDENAVWQTAPGLFVVDDGALTDLGEMQSAERRIRFEIERIQKDGPVSTYGAPRPLPSDKAEQVQQLQADLDALLADRDLSLGRTKPSASARRTSAQIGQQTDNARLSGYREIQEMGPRNAR